MECLSAHHEPYSTTQVVYLLNACQLFEAALTEYQILFPLWSLFEASIERQTGSCKHFIQLAKVFKDSPKRIHEFWSILDLFALQG